MGDLNAVDIAQMRHLDLLDKFGAVDPELIIEYGSPLPDSDVLVGIYVDDLLVMHIFDQSLDVKIRALMRT